MGLNEINVGSLLMKSLNAYFEKSKFTFEQLKNICISMKPITEVTTEVKKIITQAKESDLANMKKAFKAELSKLDQSNTSAAADVVARAHARRGQQARVTMSQQQDVLGMIISQASDGIVSRIENEGAAARTRIQEQSRANILAIQKKGMQDRQALKIETLNHLYKSLCKMASEHYELLLLAIQSSGIKTLPNEQQALKQIILHMDLHIKGQKKVGTLVKLDQEIAKIDQTIQKKKTELDGVKQSKSALELKQSNLKTKKDVLINNKERQSNHWSAVLMMTLISAAVTLLTFILMPQLIIVTLFFAVLTSVLGIGLHFAHQSFETINSEFHFIVDAISENEKELKDVNIQLNTLPGKIKKAEDEASSVRERRGLYTQDSINHLEEAKKIDANSVALTPQGSPFSFWSPSARVVDDLDSDLGSNMGADLGSDLGSNAGADLGSDLGSDVGSEIDLGDLGVSRPGL